MRGENLLGADAVILWGPGQALGQNLFSGAQWEPSLPSFAEAEASLFGENGGFW